VKSWLEGLLASRLLGKLQVAKLRAELSVHVGRVEALESRLADLADRFSRFQNRQAMRSARQAMEVDQEDLADAQAILAQAERPEGVAGASQDKPDKLALWKRRRLS
jgi:hypothetical protein